MKLKKLLPKHFGFNYMYEDDVNEVLLGYVKNKKLIVINNNLGCKIEMNMFDLLKFIIKAYISCLFRRN